MVLELLREKIGDQRFFAVLRAWAAEHRHGNATSDSSRTWRARSPART
jgi:hypothetical protein